MSEKNRIIIAGIILLATLILLGIFAKAENPETETITVTVSEGDTLWGIWEQYGYGRADKWIAETEKANGMRTADLKVGDKLEICVPK